MNTTAIAVVEPQEAVSLLESPLSPAETAELQSCELAIELAGKDRLEKALIIGEKLSTIYNHALFRGADGGCTWDQWVATRLVELLPDEATGKPGWADTRRLLWEQRKLISCSKVRAALLPCSLKTAESMASLVPRSANGPSGWQPAILDDPDAAEGIAKVWELACRNAEANQRRNGPTAEDVRAAREELRPALQQQGLIRSAPASFQAATIARVQAAKERTVDVAAVGDVMANIRATREERAEKVKAKEIRDELSRADRERQETLEQEVRTYSARLHGASKAVHELHTYLQNLSRIHGTQLLDELRGIEVLGLISVHDDMQRLQEMGKELVEAVRLAQSSEPPSGIQVQTLNL